MGMRVGGAASSAATAAWQTRRQDFGNLVSAIKGGNLGDAQQAFATLSSLGGAGSTTSGAGASATGSGGPLAAVGQALGNGDIQAAQKALAQMFANGTGGGHHHHHGGQAAAGSATTPVQQPLPAGTTISTLA